MRRQIYVSLGVILLLLAFAGLALAAPVPTLERSVMAGGGGRGEQGGLVMFGTVGQPVVGRSASGDDLLCTGFWCGGAGGGGAYQIYLPVVLKN